MLFSIHINLIRNRVTRSHNNTQQYSHMTPILGIFESPECETSPQFVLYKFWHVLELTMFIKRIVNREDVSTFRVQVTDPSVSCVILFFLRSRRQLLSSFRVINPFVRPQVCRMLENVQLESFLFLFNVKLSGNWKSMSWNTLIIWSFFLLDVNHLPLSFHYFTY